jgi:hypothetical protein
MQIEAKMLATLENGRHSRHLRDLLTSRPSRSLIQVRGPASLAGVQAAAGDALAGLTRLPPCYVAARASSRDL